MAEARVATAEPLPPWHAAEIDPSMHTLQVKASGEGLSFFIPAPRYIIRGLVRLFRRVRTKVEMAFAPIPIPVVFTLQTIATVIFMKAQSGEGVRNSRLANFLWKLDLKWNPLSHRISNESRVAYLTLGFGLSVVGVFSYGQRMFLRFLLSYTDWMLEGRGKKTLMTKIWGFLLTYIYMVRPSERMLAYQSVMPYQPVPAVEDTVGRYLESMEPILDAEEYAEVKEKSKTFLQTEASKLQWVLRLKWLFSSNYISDWWLNYVYLRGRGSIFINSNFYGFSIYGEPPTTSQSARAAVIVHLFLQQRRDVDSERIKPLMVQNIVPLCMSQYVSAFSTTREPHPEQDRLVTYDPPESRHICVIYKGHYYKLNVYDDRLGYGTILSPLQLEAAIRRIIESTDRAVEAHGLPAEADLAALTTDDRSTWASVRTDILQSDRVSRAGLSVIERSIMVLTILDQEGVSYQETTKLARTFFHHDGKSYWADKSANVVLTKDGHLGLIGEHTWADAPVLAHLYDIVLSYEECNKEKWYDSENGGVVKATTQEREQLNAGTLKVFHASRIPFHVTGALKDAMKHSVERVTKAIADTDHICNRFPNYGKGVMKQAKCSPDAWVQMALQLVYFRTMGKFTQTYESSMSRLFRDGRTETVRSATRQSCEFVRAMENQSIDRATRAKLLQKACENHHHLTTMAMTGKGVDRHLFGLYVAAASLDVNCEFLKSALSRGWKLSTSQTPAGQSPEHWKALPDHWDTHPRPGGGFGSVSDEGFGVSYTFCGDNFIFFHVSSKVQCPDTNSEKFWEDLKDALNEMAGLFNIENKHFVIAPSK